MCVSRGYSLGSLMENREYIASWVCVSSFVPSWLSVRLLWSAVCVVSLVMRRPPKSLTRVSLKYVPL